MRSVRWSGYSAFILSVAFSLSLAAKDQGQHDPEIPSGFQIVAQDDCGNPGHQPHFGSGINYAATENDRKGFKIDDPRLNTLVYGDQAVVFYYNGLRPKARYFLRVFYCTFNATIDKAVRLDANGIELHGPLVMTTGQPAVRTIALPAAAYKDSALKLTFTRVDGPHAFVSAIELWSDQPGLVTPKDPEIPAGFQIVAHDDCGNPAQQSHLFSGINFAATENDKKGFKIDDPRLTTVAYGDPSVVFYYGGLHPKARYFLRLFYCTFSNDIDRFVRLDANGVDLHGPVELTKGQPLVRTIALPAAVYKDSILKLTFSKGDCPHAAVAAIELWSDQPGTLSALGSFVRFRVDQLPEGPAGLSVGAAWGNARFSLTPEPMRKTGFTPWVDLRKTPCHASGLLTITIPKGARGATQFSRVQDDQAIIREIDWSESEGTRFFISPNFDDIRTFRDQERRYYLNAAEIAQNRLYPLTRPPLLFANAWGWVTGGPAEYMVKSFRLLGLNCVATSEDQAKYESLYGWGSQGGHYAPPTYMPYDAGKSLLMYTNYYRDYCGKFKPGAGNGMLSFQMADEPGELPLKGPEAEAGFRKWLAGQGLKPKFFGKDKWDDVSLLTNDPKTPEDQRRFYWSHRYQGMMTPKMYGLACEAFCQEAPGKAVKPFVALSGHSLYFGNRLPLDMFQLAQYPHMTPGISDWMTNGSWFWDSHQAVAYSVAPYNAGARRYGADFGKPPISFPMMHCVYPSLFRAYTQLANQCKLISYYNYGPDYIGAEGAWSASDWARYVVHHVNNQVAQVDDILSPGRMRPSRVAMLYSMSNEYRRANWSFPDKRATFLALSHDYYQPELVTEDQIAAGALQYYDALYVLDFGISEPAQKKIESWVNDGGLLWACQDAGIVNEYDEPCDLLDHLAGLKRTLSYTNATGKALLVSPVKGQAEFEPHNVPSWNRAVSVVWDGARIRATYGDGAPAWLERNVKKGKVVYVGHRAGVSYSQRAGKSRDMSIWPTSGRQFITQPLLDTDVRRELVLSTPLIMAMPLSSENGTAVILYNMTPQGVNNLVIRLREAEKPVSVQCFEVSKLELVNLPFDYKDGWVTMTLADMPWYGNIIVVRSKPAPADDRLEKMRLDTEAHLASSDWQTLSAGAWFAGFFPAWKLGPKLVPLLTHEHWAVRRSAAESLGRLGDASAGKALRKAVDGEKDPHAFVDEIAALALLGHPDAPALCRGLRESLDPFRQAEGARIAKLLKSPAP